MLESLSCFSSFPQEGEGAQRLEFSERLIVREGVTCFSYKFHDDPSKDIAFVHVEAGAKTPLQEVIGGSRTVEGYMSGSGCFEMWSSTTSIKCYEVAPGVSFEIVVPQGWRMQWKADSNFNLVFYELCWPPYSDGRFRDLD